MRLRSPAENYIRYLIVHPDHFNTAAIKERLIDEDLDFISPLYIDRLRTKLQPPDPFYPYEKRHAPSFKFIVKEKMNRMFLPDMAMNIALEILDTPRAKEFVETMALVEVPPMSISAHLTRHYRVYCTVEALELYQHYFWNTKLLDTSQMRVLMQMRIKFNAENVPELAGCEKILASAYYKDARTIAADLPSSPTTATLAQMRLGIKPTRQEIAMRLIEARDLASMRAIEAVAKDGLDDSKKFLDYVNGTRALEELVQLAVKPEDQMREQLRAIALRTDTNELPSIHQLSEGRHTVDVVPIKDPDHVGDGIIEYEASDGDDADYSEGATSSASVFPPDD